MMMELIRRLSRCTLHRPVITCLRWHHPSEYFGSEPDTEWTMSHFDFWSVRFLQYTILRNSTRLVNIMNITSYEAHSPFIFRTARTEYTKIATTTR